MPKKKQDKDIDQDMKQEQIQDFIETLEEEIETLKEEITSYKDRWLRGAAEFENFRRRNEKDRIDWIKNANKDLITELINVYEHLEMAMKSADTDKIPENYRKGIIMVHDQLKDLLKKYGLKRIDAVGVEFDPQYHQAIICTPKEGFDDNVIFDCIQSGYMLNDKVLRPARVAVAKSPEETDEQEDPDLEEDHDDGEKIKINAHKKRKKNKF